MKINNLFAEYQGEGGRFESSFGDLGDIGNLNRLSTVVAECGFLAPFFPVQGWNTANLYSPAEGRWPHRRWPSSNLNVQNHRI